MISFSKSIGWELANYQTEARGMGFAGGPVVKNAPASRRLGVEPSGQEDPWSRKRQPTPVFTPGEPHGQRSRAGCAPRGREQQDTTEQLHGNS